MLEIKHSTEPVLSLRITTHGDITYISMKDTASEETISFRIDTDTLLAELGVPEPPLSLSDRQTAHVMGLEAILRHKNSRIKEVSEDLTVQRLQSEEQYNLGYQAGLDAARAQTFPKAQPFTGDAAKLFGVIYAHLAQHNLPIDFEALTKFVSTVDTEPEA